MHTSRFATFVPFELIAKSSDDSLGKIKGIATSESVDADREVIKQNGLDWSFFLNKGTLTYEHPLGALNIVGEPTAVRLIKKGGVSATEIEGVLYLDDPLGKELWKKASTMKKAGGGRALGFSIEGRIPKGGRAGKVIKKAVVHSVAISPVPKNPDSWWEPLAASLGAAFRAGHTLDEILQRAETYGYPAQGAAAAGAGGLGKLGPQSIQNKIDKKWLKDLSNDDLAVLHVLKNLPDTTTWAQGIAVYNVMRSKLRVK